MTFIVECDECGREAIVQGHLPFGWHTVIWDGKRIPEKQVCPECWNKRFEGGRVGECQKT